MGHFICARVQGESVLGRNFSAVGSLTADGTGRRDRFIPLLALLTIITHAPLLARSDHPVPRIEARCSLA